MKIQFNTTQGAHKTVVAEDISSAELGETFIGGSNSLIPYVNIQYKAGGKETVTFPDMAAAKIKYQEITNKM